MFFVWYVLLASDIPAVLEVQEWWYHLLLGQSWGEVGMSTRAEMPE